MPRAKYPYPPELYDREVGARSLQAALANARLADELGYDWVSVSEHHFAPGIMTPNALVFAGALTQVVKRAKIALLGPIVSINNPVRLAEEIAMLDLMSGGRILVFLLRGTSNEFNTYYVNPLETRERAQEAIELIERALTEPQPFGWVGRYFRFPTVAVWPRPSQTPRPFIFSSGNSPESCVFAAHHKHGLAMSFIPPDLVVKAVQLYKSECAKAGWEPTQEHILYRGFTAIAESEEEAQQQQRARDFDPRRANAGAPRGLGPLSWMEHRNQGEGNSGNGDGAYNPNEDGAARAGEGFGLGSLQFRGRPETVVEQIERFHELTGVGVLDMIFSGARGPEGMARCIELFGTEVLPRIRSLGEPAPARERLAAV
jgi:alkanesulfonate monooxygenase SsuD/methylene tetrahydromethanopterin reductase-like flavin-dependent oxidoreductase (luciferase family)